MITTVQIAGSKKSKFKETQTMKHKYQLISVVVGISTCGAAALAQQTSAPMNQVGYQNQSSAQAEQMRAFGSAQKASDLIGMEVKNNQDENLGKVQDVAVDVKAGRIVYVIVATGGVAGMDRTLHAVPPGAMRLDVPNHALQFDAGKEKLDAAPAFEMSKWDDCSDSNRVAKVYGYYGMHPYFMRPDGSTATDAMSPRQREQQEDSHPMMSQNGPWAPLGDVRRASKTMGSSVVNRQDEKLGKIENLVVDLPAGRIVAVVISSGGFIGIGDELSAVPPSVLDYNYDRSAFQMNASRETLKNAPHFKAGEWSELGQPGYVTQVYRAYGVEPYFNPAPRGDSAVTPSDQGNVLSDTDISAQIRREIKTDNDVSADANNVEVTTSNGRVTLRGSVDSANEKRLIGEIAGKVTQPQKVDNQLEIK
jgi:sporulation protein YlmC with PRC-barrel domain